jgi:hypothetical protein
LLGMQSVKKSKDHPKSTTLSLCYVTILLLEGDIPKTAPAAWLWTLARNKRKKQCAI